MAVTTLADYRDAFYARYRSTHTGPRKGDSTRQSHLARYPLWESLLRPYLPPGKDSRILDLGCGDGAILSWLIDLGYRAARGVDVSGEEVAAARALGLPVEQGEMLEVLARADQGYDLIILRNVLEHHRKDEILELLGGVRDALADGGRVFIQVPNAESPFGARIRYGDFTHELAFTASSISQVLRVCGFQDIHVGPVEPVFRGRRKLRWALVKRLYRWLLYSEVPLPNQIITQDLHAVARVRN